MLDSPIQEIKNRLDIADVVREYVTLEKAGANLRAPCPFHQEKTPSFFVNPSRQIWRCFGSCNEGGDIFQFVMKMEGVEFADALRILAKKAGVKLKQQNKEEETKTKRMLDICELSTLFFSEQLQKSKHGKEVQEYLKKRGITKESIQEWRIGYAPVAKDFLAKYLIGEGYTREEIVQAGVCVGKNNYSFDRFRGRIIFPIFNISGSVVGFGGRVFFEKDKRAKYINSPSTPLYDKSKIMYGLYSAKMEIRRVDQSIIVEGYTDVILSHQSGYKNVVSSSGTALTENQLEILKRYSKRMLTAFDMDSAGMSATEKGISIAQEKGFDIKIIAMEKDEDPADVILEDKKKWEKYIKNAIPVMEFYFRNTFSKYDLNNPREKGEAAAELLPKIKKINNDIERAHFISLLARKLNVREEAIRTEMEKIKIKETDKKEETVKKKEERKARKDLLEEKILSFCINNKNLAKKIKEEDASIFKQNTINIISFLKEEKKVLDKEDEEILNQLSFLTSEGEIDIEKELDYCIREVNKEFIKGKLREIEEEIRRAEEDKNEKEVEKLIKKFSKNSKQLQGL